LPTIFSQVLISLVVICGLIRRLNTLYKQRGYWDEVGEKDLALITGGSNGLGLEISKLLSQKQVRVIILDKEPPGESCFHNDKVHFIECDLNNESQLLRQINKIKTTIGIPTILINNAAIRHNESLLDLEYTKIKEILQINTLSQVILLKEIIKDVKPTSRLYIVTIASILGLVSPSHLSIYSATKAAIISLHDSVSHEIQKANIRFLLVTPGQLNTRLFSDVKPPRQFFAPVINAKDLASQIVGKFELGERGTLHGPLYTYFIPLLRMLPYSFNEFARSFSQMDTSVMDQHDQNFKKL